VTEASEAARAAKEAVDEFTVANPVRRALSLGYVPPCCHHALG